MIDGKAVLTREDYCDDLGDCLPACPADAIHFEMREAPAYDEAHLLIAADCTAYAYGDFHNEFIRDHITLIGCPKLDAIDYAEKLTQILAANTIKNITVTRMQVPCCGGIENAVKRALLASGQSIPLRIVTISSDGQIVKESSGV